MLCQARKANWTTVSLLPNQYYHLRFSSFFLQQYLKFLRSLACGGFHFYFVTQHSVSDLSLYDQISGRLRFNANSVTLKEGNWFPGTLTNWKFSKDFVIFPLQFMPCLLRIVLLIFRQIK